MDQANALAPALLGAAAAASLLTVLFVLVWLPRALRTPSSWVGHRPLIGTIARIVVTVPCGGVGRIAYTAGAKRCSMGARSDEPGAIAVGTEVAIIALDRGLAVVAPFDLERKLS
ncbi:MAG TPA: hypothetical protein VFB62_18540 [Polyangiaceae bacterium]|jgi:hypothetical protein|nr:hypothetical protein [Polyangiaceae bacterium]